MAGFVDQMAGLFNGGGTPSYNAPDMSPEQRAAIDKVTQGALNSSVASEQTAFAPVQAKGLLGADKGDFNKALSYGDDPTLAAIRSRTDQKLGREQDKINVEAKNVARAAYSDRLAHAAQLAGDEAQANFQKEMMKRQQRLAQKAARGQALGTILGIGGAIGGGVVGGPLGASAGAGLGAAGGNMIGSQ